MHSISVKKEAPAIWRGLVRSQVVLSLRRASPRLCEAEKEEVEKYEQARHIESQEFRLRSALRVVADPQKRWESFGRLLHQRLLTPGVS
jgi:hypothetical protein